MNSEVETCLSSFPEPIKSLFAQLRALVLEEGSAEEKLWAKLPSYYAGNRFVRLIPFRDHINIEAQAAAAHRDMLKEYKMTPKGFLQLYLHQPVPVEALRLIFRETLGNIAE